MKRNLCLVFCGEDSESAKAMAASVRNDEWQAVIVSAFEFNGPEWEPDRVVIMSDAPRWQADRIVAAYPGAERASEQKAEAKIIPIMAAPKRRGRPKKVVA